MQMISRRLAAKQVLIGGGTLAVVLGEASWGKTLAAGEEKSINFQLSWYHAGTYGPYYAATKKGFFRDEGLSVNFLEGGANVDPVQTLMDGKAQIGIVSASHLLQARSEGKPVKAVAVMHQINPVVFIVLAGSPITHPKQFAGKTIRATSPNLSLLHAVAQRFGIRPDQFEVVADRSLDRFYAGEIDVWTGFHFYTKRRMAKAGRDGRFMYPDDYGIHFYRDCIFATDDFIAKRPDLVLRFLRAALKRGWDYALRNPEASAAMIKDYKPEADVAAESEFMLSMIPLFNTGRVPVGWMKPETWAEMADSLHRNAVLPAPLDPSQAYTMDFLHEIYGLGG